MPRMILSLCALALLAVSAVAQDAPYTRTEDVIYGRKDGMALTLDVFAPKEKANGAGVIFCVSGGWYSAKASTPVALITPLTKRGYTVFAVCHGSQPKYTIPEVLGDMHNAVRFVRTNAAKYKVDPERLGITGGSAGGHLSLMQGVAPKPADTLNKVSSSVQAVACFFPPTDFLNYGKEGEIALGNGTLAGFRPPFDFWERDPKAGNKLVVISDEEKRKAIGKTISPAHLVTNKSAPALIVHGDADKLVPIQQAELVIEAYKKAGVPAELVVKKGAAHGWPKMDADMELFADWFDKHLAKK